MRHRAAHAASLLASILATGGLAHNGALMFTDGFERGTPGAWSSSAP